MRYFLSYFANTLSIRRCVSLLGYSLILVLLMTLDVRGKSLSRVRNCTRLMFVGEDLGVLSIASRREEGAWRAPAVARVINREEFLKEGRNTLAEVLELTPGFYMALKEPGTQPYLRGIPNSVLFLYDTVNMGSDISKSLLPLDYEVSLAPVKRIEIIRGPGSVLWGPDAFAGVVNVVPMSGKDFQGIEAGLFGGTPDSKAGTYINMGFDKGLWDGFFSVTARERKEDKRCVNVLKFFGDDQGPVPPSERYGKENPDKAKYLDTYGRISLGQNISFSGKISHYSKPYAVFKENRELGWLEERSMDWGYVKLEAHKDIRDDFGLRFAGSYQWKEPKTRIVDMKIEESEKTEYLELVFDKRLWDGKGLLTGGASYRYRQIENAPIWNSYFPDYLSSDNTIFLPQLTETDYETTLYSFFFQYAHKAGPLDLVAGLRYDDHDAYEDHLSYNVGVVWSGNDNWVLKTFYGTAYRTPFSRQLLKAETPEPERISSISAQLDYKISPWLRLGVTAFRNKLKNHRMEDPYAGLSEPNGQTIDGLEFEAKTYLRKFSLEGNLTLLENDGPAETYRLIDYVFITPDGEIMKHFKNVYYPYDMGPDTLANISLAWDPTDRITAFLRLGYTSSYRLMAPRNENDIKVDSAWTVDGSLTLKRFPFRNSQLQLIFENLTNNHRDLPGIYSLRDASGTSMEVCFKIKW